MASVVAGCVALRCLGPAVCSCLGAAACSACCSVGNACKCKSNKLSKLVYVLIFLFSAAFGLALRYQGQAILGSWVNAMKVCNEDPINQQSKCWGIQACYRMSATVCGFFVVLLPIVACYPPAHLGGWLLKVLLYVIMLFVSLSIPNNFYDVYAQIARAGSVLFLIAQVIIIVDFSYKTHVWLCRKIEERDAQFESAGLCSNCWKILYLFLCVLTFGGSIAGIALMGIYFGQCSLMQFFISETAIMGIICIVISLIGRVGTGLLPPCVIFAYNTYLCYGALTNNPDAACNSFVNTGKTFTTSVVIGVIIAVLSVTWAAYSSAGNMVQVVENDEAAARSRSLASPIKSWDKSDAEDDVPARNVRNPVSAPDLAGKGKEEEAEDADVEEGSAAAYGGASTARPMIKTEAPVDDRKPDRKAWLFHLMMALGGLYLAMVLTNWGDANQVDIASGNPELSEASMWVRISSQWLIHIVFIWTMVAPACCPGRDFS